MTDRPKPNLENPCGDPQHERYEELCALAMSGTLRKEESLDLESHLASCAECREAYREYKILAKDGMPHLASRYGSPEEADGWDDTAARRKLLARGGAPQPMEGPVLVQPASEFRLPQRLASHPYVVAIAACVAIAVSL